MNLVIIWGFLITVILIVIRLLIARPRNENPSKERISNVEQLSHANRRANLEIGRVFDQIKEQVDHLATVQMLILKEMGKEHQFQPARDVLVTIGNMSDLKKTKERSA